MHKPLNGLWNEENKLRNSEVEESIQYLNTELKKSGYYVNRDAEQLWNEQNGLWMKYERARIIKKGIKNVF